MKKLLFLILLTFLFSCEKDRSIECWTCRWEEKIFKTSAYHSTINDTCMSEHDILTYQNKNTWETDIKKNRIMCWKQGDPSLPNPGF